LNQFNLRWAIQIPRSLSILHFHWSSYCACHPIVFISIRKPKRLTAYLCSPSLTRRSAVALLAFLENAQLSRAFVYFLALVALLPSRSIVSRQVNQFDVDRAGRLAFAAIALIVCRSAPGRKFSNVRPTSTSSRKNIGRTKTVDLIVLGPGNTGFPSIVIITARRRRSRSRRLSIFASIATTFPRKNGVRTSIDDVMEKIHRRSRWKPGWIVGGIKLPPDVVRPARCRPRRTRMPAGTTSPTSDAWMEQLATLFASTVKHGKMFRAIARPINLFEDVPCSLVDGWQ